MEHSVCFTGHRIMHEANRLYLGSWLPQQIRALYARGFRIFLSGGALGFDLMAAEAVLALRDELPGLRLRLLLPCRNQQARWSGQWQARYAAVLRQADAVELLYDGDIVSRETFLRRDDALVERSAVCVAFYNRSRSGTGHTVRYARSLGKEIILTAGIGG